MCRFHETVNVVAFYDKLESKGASSPTTLSGLLSLGCHRQGVRGLYKGMLFIRLFILSSHHPSVRRSLPGDSKSTSSTALTEVLLLDPYVYASCLLLCSQVLFVCVLVCH